MLFQTFTPKKRAVFSIGLLVLMALCVPVAAQGLVYFSGHSRFFLKMLVLAALGAVMFLIGWNAENRPIRRVGLGALAVALIASAGFKSWVWLTDERFITAQQKIAAWRYRPFAAFNNALVRTEAPPELRITQPADLWIQGPPMFYPLYAAAIQALCPPGDYDKNISVFTGASLFKTFSYNSGLLLFSTEPSERQRRLIRLGADYGPYEMTPFAHEALVFFVNPENPVDNLSITAIHDIYNGLTTDWQQLGSTASLPIIPFKRDPDSGAYAMLEKTIGEIPHGVGKTTEYRNFPGSIGFSFRYYVKDEPRIKILSIDGIAPTPENIANGTYPFITTCYIITVRPRSEGTQKFIDFMLSPPGREIIEKTGYTPLPLSI